MQKQKICIIGGGLTGLITAITLSKLNLKIDLIASNVNPSFVTNKTIAFSQSNYEFLKKQNIFKFSKNDLWPCSKMKLYTRDKNEKVKEIFDLNVKEKYKEKILYMAKSSKIIKHAVTNVKKNKSINLKTYNTISEIISSGLLKSVKPSKEKNSKYNLIIVCTGGNSDLVKKHFDNQVLQRSYEEVSITTNIKHGIIKNNTARQIFLDDEVLALLPISNRETSLVWTLKKNKIIKYKNKKDFYVKKKLKIYTKNFFKKIKFSKSLEYKDLHFLIRKKYHADRTLLFGDALHLVHPLAGQGFNMVLRDLKSLEKILKNKINLGLDIGSSDILSDFSKETKPRNLFYSLGIDLLKKSFFLQKKPVKYFRNKVINELNKKDFAKNIIFTFADKGFRF
tara:strand:+ start:621 stop:1802 length:1182 start_codon:yes stop_codon:yes gene_type:complete